MLGITARDTQVAQSVTLKGKVLPLPSGATVEITDASQVEMGVGFTFRVLTYPANTVEIVWEVRNLAPACVSVHLVAGEMPIKAKALAAIKLDQIRDEVYAVAGVGAFTPDGTDDYELTGTDARKAVRRATRQKITPEFLHTVADVYNGAPDGNRLAAVKAAFKVYERQALRYIAKIREEGLI